MKRFNLGDTVYLMTDNKIAKGEITYVQTIERKRKGDSYPSEGFELTNDPTFGLKEVKTTYSVSIYQGQIVKFDIPDDVLFPTMEELLETLKTTSI
jgi:hypothetical protein